MTTPTMNKMVKVYLESATVERLKCGKPNEGTVKNTLVGYRKFIQWMNERRQRQGHERKALDDDFPLVSIIKPNLIHSYLADLLRQGTKPITAISYLYQLRQLFAKWVLPYYEDHSWKIPPFPSFGNRPKAPRYNRPPAEQLAKLKAWYEALSKSAECGVQSAETSAECGVRRDECGAKSAECGVQSAEDDVVGSAEGDAQSAEIGVECGEKDELRTPHSAPRTPRTPHSALRTQNLWFVTTMMLEFAMRNSDIMRLKRKNFVEREGRVYLNYTPHKTEHSSGRMVKWPVHPTIWDQISSILVGDDLPELDDDIFDELNLKMRSMGFTGTKGAYELRKICVDHVYQRFGAEMAVSISGDDIRTIMHYYADPAQPNIDNIRVTDLL